MGAFGNRDSDKAIRNIKAGGLRARLALSTALAALFMGGYGGRSAYAGCAYDGSPGTYLCSGAADTGGLDTPVDISLLTPLTVTTASGFGIDTRNKAYSNFAFRFVSSNGLTFTDNNNSAITSDLIGLQAANRFGALSITTTGRVEGIDRYGIFARQDFGTSLTISAANTYGADMGIRAILGLYNSGALTITTTGRTVGRTGIYAYQQFGTSLTISAAETYGTDIGIQAENTGSGALSITTTGRTAGKTGIMATNGNGVDAYGQSLTITAMGQVVGGTYGTGMIVKNYGAGALSITTNELVTAPGSGIFARNGKKLAPAGTDMTISTAAVSGGIVADNFGSGVLSVTSSGPVDGNGNGIRAINFYGTNLKVTSAAVSGGARGILARNLGSGYTTVTTTGPVTGGGFSGIYASTDGTDLTVTTASVSGGRDGIRALNTGAGTTSITVTGAVAGGSGSGIKTMTGAGKQTTITLNSGAEVSSASGLAISNDAGDSATTVKTGAGVTGEIRLGDGDDDLTFFAGGDFSQVTKFDGGGIDATAGTDTLKFDGSSGVLNGADVINWESLIITGGSAIGFGDSLLTVGDGSPGTGLFVNGGGSLVTNIFAFDDFDLLDVNGAVDFGIGGALDFNFDAGFAASDGLSLTFLTADSLIGFNNLAFHFSGLGALFAADVFQLGNTLTLDFALIGDGDPSVIPLPPSLVLFGSGLLGLAGLRRVRRLKREFAE